jgi:hypothetical protein
MNKRILLSNDDIHAIMNQMEVPVSMKAAELADVIFEKRVRAKQRAYEGLKTKVLNSTTRMTADLESSTELDLSDDDMLALAQVTDGLRELGYKYSLIEVQDSSGNILKHKLRISIAHLMTT